jgi:hypothetical protein
MILTNELLKWKKKIYFLKQIWCTLDNMSLGLKTVLPFRMELYFVAGRR